MRGYRAPLPIRERLERKTTYDGDCWRWNGATYTDGYGVMMTARAARWPK